MGLIWCDDVPFGVYEIVFENMLVSREIFEVNAAQWMRYDQLAELSNVSGVGVCY